MPEREWPKLMLGTNEEMIRSIMDAHTGVMWMIGTAVFLHRPDNRAAFAGLIASHLGKSTGEVLEILDVRERFRNDVDKFPHLHYRHFAAALRWDDALECLAWAEEMFATVSEMRAWRRVKRGEDLSAEAFADQPAEEPASNQGVIEFVDIDPVIQEQVERILRQRGLIT